MNKNFWENKSAGPVWEFLMRYFFMSYNKNMKWDPSALRNKNKLHIGMDASNKSENDFQILQSTVSNLT